MNTRARVPSANAPFLSCLYGSEQTRQNYLEKLKFLSCLYGSERMQDMK
ncbi:hypothetical protein HMPREF9532_00449 [Escherichia coli MS 57-2]|nr:hypothetical protein HMPREF9532_00449 [Escherichia coli MS 57-2]ESD40178.1 hypothetical protein HMPREF1604_02912 [Escherichia coli 908519]